jgi:hypothetical protein
LITSKRRTSTSGSSLWSSPDTKRSSNQDHQTALSRPTYEGAPGTNRSGLLVDACLTKVSGHAERIAALAMIESRADRPRPIMLGADRGYDAEDFVNELRSMNVHPHVAQNLTRSRGRSAIDGRTTRPPAMPSASASASASRRASAG